MEEALTRKLFSLELTAKSRFELRILIGSLSVQLAVLDPDLEAKEEVQASLSELRQELAKRPAERER